MSDTDSLTRQVVGATDPAQSIQACWSDIGVYGKGNCPELAKFIHCRNCPVYSSAGSQLLTRPLPADYRRQWTEHFTQQKKLAAQTNASALLFRISAELLALPTHAFQEVTEKRRIHSLPHRRQGIVFGLTNIRGELLVCVSLGHLLGIEKLPSLQALRTAYTRLLVANWEGARFVFPVDEVFGTHRFNLHDLKEPPATVARSNPSYTQGLLSWGNKVVGFLNGDLLFSALNRSLS